MGHFIDRQAPTLADLARTALAICERIINDPLDPAPLAEARRLAAAHPEVFTRPWRVEPVDAVQRALLDRDLEEQYGLDLSEYPHHEDSACRAVFQKPVGNSANHDDCNWGR